MQKLIVLRRAHPVFRRRQFLRGSEEDGSGLPDVWWFRTDGQRMTKRTGSPARGSSACSSTARRSRRPTRRAERILDESFLLFFNAEHEDCTFTLPDAPLRRALGARS